MAYVRSPMYFLSHRGGSGEAPENTIAAFKQALEKGTHMLELDVHLTKDGKVCGVSREGLVGFGFAAEGGVHMSPIC